jgi:hypothetical protein
MVLERELLPSPSVPWTHSAVKSSLFKGALSPSKTLILFLPACSRILRALVVPTFTPTFPATVVIPSISSSVKCASAINIAYSVVSTWISIDNYSHLI